MAYSQFLLLKLQRYMCNRPKSQTKDARLHVNGRDNLAMYFSRTLDN